jgi:hypothetical protein
MTKSTRKFSFDALKHGKLGVSEIYGSFLAEAASYCLYFKTHPNPVVLSLTGDVLSNGTLGWDEITETHRKTYADIQEATEYGACGIAIIIAVQLTGLPRVERSVKGTGVDYWLNADLDEDGIFQRAARLEVSGILDGDETKIVTRLNQKKLQTERTDKTSLPAYVAIVEFGSHEARLVKRSVEEKRP